MAPKLGENHYRHHCFMQAVIEWETLIQDRRRTKPECCGFAKEDSKQISFHLVVEFLKHHFAVHKCVRCLSVNEITCKTSKINDTVKVACLCDLWKDPEFKTKPFNSISWLGHSPKYPGAIFSSKGSLAIHLRTLYTAKDKQITFLGLAPGGDRLTLCDIIRNRVQQ